MARVKVFLSHLTIEKQLAELLQEAVNRDFIELVEFFISSDTTSIPAGDGWFDRVISGLADAHLQFVLCSPESVNRPWINFEAGAACLKAIPVVPICHSGLTPVQLGMPLGQFESLVASEREGLLKLYAKIASLIGSGVPDAKLDELVIDIKAFEAQYKARTATAAAHEAKSTSVGIITSPRVLCVTSEQFMRLRSEDFEIIQKAFPGTVTHRRELTSAAVRDALMQGHFDIVHVATYVCPKTGDLVFSDVDINTGDRTCQPSDVLPADAFASLVKGSGTSLVVIASCESFELGAELLPVTNVVATRDIVSLGMFAAWVENFYRALVYQPLSEAFAYAVKASRAPMKLYAKEDLVMADAIKQVTKPALA